MAVPRRCATFIATSVFPTAVGPTIKYTFLDWLAETKSLSSIINYPIRPEKDFRLFHFFPATAVVFHYIFCTLLPFTAKTFGHFLSPQIILLFYLHYLVRVHALDAILGRGYP